MQQRPIFAGIDQGGALRFVGDVPPGAACGCRCAACGSPLIAKKGGIKAWHFAHESGQERPDCYAGAVNLLRALVVEQLRERLERPLPACPVHVRLPSPPWPALRDRFDWEPGRAASIEWPALSTQHAPVALLTLASGTRVFVFVSVEGDGEPQASAQAGERRGGVLLLNVPLPPHAAPLKDRADATRHIAEAARWRWLALPGDVEAARETKRQALEQLARAQQQQAAAERERARHEAEAAAEKRNALRQAFEARQQRTEQPAPRNQPAAPPPSPPPDDSPWAAWRRQPSSFLLYQLTDGSRWVLLTHRDGRSILAPWPPAEDGWDEALPSRLGAVDPILGGLVLRDQTETMIYLSSRLQACRTSSDWRELAETVDALAQRNARG